MRPHTLIEKEAPSKILKSFHSTSDPRVIAVGLLALEASAAKPNSQFKLKTATTALLAPNSRGVNAIYRIMESGAGQLSTQISGSRRVNIAKKRIEVAEWLIKHNQGKAFFKSQGEPKQTPFVRFLLQVQAWHRQSDTTKAFIALMKTVPSYDQSKVEAELNKFIKPSLTAQIFV